MFCSLSAYILEQELPDESKPVWNKRHKCEIIILLDWNTTRKTKVTKLTTLKSIIINVSIFNKFLSRNFYWFITLFSGILPMIMRQ